MSTPSVGVQPVKNPVLPDKITPEIRYWRAFRSPLIVKESNAINHIHFSPSSPHDFAVTSSTRIQIFSAKTRQVTKTISRFKDTVYSGEFRQDGKLIVAGDATGLIQVFDVNSRSVLVTLQPSAYPCHVTKFSGNSTTGGVNLLSASDDKIARLWDLTSSTPVAEFKDHNDYIRTADFIPNASSSSNLVATGCYDGMLRIYDYRTSSSKCIAEYDQFAPVESVLALNSTTMVAASGPSVKVWDITSGRVVKEISNFQKTVTTLAKSDPTDTKDAYIFAGSLDGHVKVISPSKWTVNFGWKFGGAVLSTGIAPNHKHFVTGLTSGLLSIRTRKTEPRVAQGVKKEKSSNFARMIRGAEYHGETEHTVIDDKPTRAQKRKLKNYEKHISAFRWGDALDNAFSNGLSADVTVTILEELKKRGKVAVSLSGRDEDSLEPILKWAIKAAQDTRSVPIMVDWIGVVVDMYGGLIERSPVLEALMEQLQGKIKKQINEAKESQRIQGMLELLSH